MQDFFRKHGVAVMTIRELFDFIVDPSITDESVDSYLEEVLYFSETLVLNFREIFIHTARVIFCRVISKLVSGSTKNFGQRGCDFTGG